MILPSTQAERAKVYRNRARECAVSMDTRRPRYRSNRMWYLTGSDTGQRARYNKLLEHVSFSSAYLYAPDSVRFGVVLPPHYGDQWIPECDAAKEELHRLWHDSDAGLAFDQMVTWAHVYDTMVGKVVVSNGAPTLVPIADPADIGVWNEAADDWDTDEAIVHYYSLDVARFARMVAPHPNARRLIETAEAYAVPGFEASEQGLPPTIQRTILLSQASPNLIGAVQGLGDTSLAIPQVIAPMVRMAELWIRDDAIQDYRVVTILQATEDILWEPRNPLVPGEHPFHPLTLLPTPGYRWGVAPIEYLIAMQSWREDKMRQLDDRDDKLIDPPILFKGFTQITDEQALRFRAKGGNLATQNPTAEAHPFPPSPVAEPYQIIDRIDTDFSRQGGLPKGLTGQTEPGVRSGEQAESQALMAAGPTMKKAMYVEGALEGIATQMLRLQRRVSGETIQKTEEHAAHEFLLAQIPGDVVARVWAHSASPLYAKELVAKAKLAHDAKAIDNEDYLEYLNLPLTDTKLKAKARKMAEAAAARQQEMLDLKKKEVQAKVEKAEASARKI